MRSASASTKRGETVSVTSVTRRAALSSLGVFAVIRPGLVRPARAQKAVRFRDIRVDVWRLRADAGDATADWIEEELPKDLAQVLTPYMAPAERNGATLLARIETIDLGSSGGARGAGGATDSMEGVLIVSGPRGVIAAETPLRATASYEPNAVDQSLFEEAYHRRVIALAEAFAGWAPRQLGI
jgi:hypothetical protein